MLDWIWLIPVIPVVSAGLLGLFGKRFLSKRVVAVIACGAILVSFLISVGAVLELRGLPAGMGGHRVSVAEWIDAGTVVTEGGGEARFQIDWAFRLDALSGLMVLVVTGVGFLIHLYSVGYMAKDPGFWRFFSYLNLFTGMMLVLVLGASFPVMFVGWEGVGLSSYLLIGFWYRQEFCAQAGRKAFLLNRIGDAGFLLAVAGIFGSFGTFEIREVMEAVARGEGPSVAWRTTLALLLFIGACGKSAQVPLYVWLPDAMAGPTPVSALIHAATMVTAGVYMVCRCGALFSSAPVAMAVVAVVGTVTLLLAGTIALLQNDIKKVLAYSTISQLGFMFLAAGVGAYSVAMFHLMTHAFFKAVLFLGAGSVMHALGNEQDMRKMGGLFRALPWTGTAMLLGSLSMVGIPGFAGFFSKDGILLGAYMGNNRILWYLAVVGAMLTGFYIFRLIFLTFFGASRVAPGVHPHESPWSMRSVLVVLGVLSVVGGWIGIPAVMGGNDWLGQRLAGALPEVHPGEHHLAVSVEFLLMGVALGVGLAGLYLAWRWCVQRPREAESLSRGPLAGVHRLVAGRYFVDELYDRVIVDPFYRICRWSDRFDARVVDGMVNGSRHFTVGSSYVMAFWDEWVVDGLVNLVGYSMRGISWLLRRIQTGLVQNYATAMIFGLFVLISIFLFLTG
ncbi:MAG: NADH-quinone oxidoreductase subunit L [Acidobacteriota bacterium]